MSAKPNLQSDVKTCVSRVASLIGTDVFVDTVTHDDLRQRWPTSRSHSFYCVTTKSPHDNENFSTFSCHFESEFSRLFASTLMRERFMYSKMA